MEYLFYFIILLSDLRYRKIYNHQILVLLLYFISYGYWGDETGVAYSLLFLILGTFPLTLRFVGGGDIKLISCLSLTLYSDFMIIFLLLIPVLGVIFHPFIKFFEWVLNINNITKDKKGIPFSFAIITSFIIVQKLGV